MDLDEQQQLFGAPMGGVERCTVELHRPSVLGRTEVTISVESVNRNKIMRIHLFCNDAEETYDAIAIGQAILNCSVFCTGETIRLRMVAKVRHWAGKGRNFDHSYIGRIPAP